MANNFILPISTQTAAQDRIGVVKIGSNPNSTGINAQQDGTLTLINSGITPGTYFKTTVDTFGRVTAGANPTTLFGFGITDGTSNVNAIISTSAKIISNATMSAGTDANKVFIVQDSANTPMLTVAQTGLTTVRSNVTFLAGTSTDEALRIESSDQIPLFRVMTNGDAVIGGIIKVNGNGVSEFNGNVTVGGLLTVQGQTFSGDNGTTATIGENFTVNGKLVVKGDTDLGDNASSDKVTIRALTKVVSPVTKVLGSSTAEAFLVTDSADVPLFQVMQNGDALIAGIIKVKGEGTSEFTGDVTIGGRLTVMSGATINGIMQNDTMTLTGNLTVQGNTQLGDNSAADTTIIKGVTTIISPTTKSAGTNAGTAFLVKSTDNADLFKVSTNGDVSIGGKLTVAQGASVSAAMTGSDLTLTGNLVVQGNTQLGDNAATDSTIINGITTIVSKATKSGGNSATNVFLVKSSDSQDLLAVKENGDTIIGGKVTINGSAMSTVGDVVVSGNLSVTGNSTLNGNVTFGDASSDTIKSMAPLNMNNNKIYNLPEPVQGNEPATKYYVDSLIQGLDIKQSVRFTTTANLSATYSSAAKTLTASSNSVFPAIDGTATPTFGLGDRILVKDQTNKTQNGIYAITSLGSASVPWVLTRTADFTTNTATSGSFVFIEDGTVNANTGWVMVSDNVIIDTTNIVWSQFSGAGMLTAGNGTIIDGNQIDLLPATATTIGAVIASDTTNTTIDASGNLRIKADSVNTANYIVRRDSSGNINVSTLNATAVVSTGTVSGSALSTAGILTAGSANITSTLSTSGAATIGGALNVTGLPNFTTKINKVLNVSTAGSFGVQTITANAVDQAIGTSATTIATFTPTVNGNFLVHIYVRIAAATTLSIDLTYNDGTSQLLNIMSGAQAVGSYSVSSVFIYAKSSAPITLVATAGAATSAYVSANIAGF